VCIFLLQAYKISKAKRGKCVIFNMERVGSYPKRKGTRVDGNLLDQLFTQLNFEVKHLFNYTAKVCVCSISLLLTAKLLLARLMVQYCFVRCCLSSSSVVVCNARGRSTAAGPGVWPVRRPTLHGGTVRLCPVRVTLCF